jgi:uncharacterized protein YbgA (DUF1722 family)
MTNLSIGPLFSQMQALRRCASRGTHSNVLQHLSGYFKDALTQQDKAELQAVIGQYQQAWYHW